MWLRAETKPQETRTPVTPAGVKELIAAGNDIVVESAGHHTRRGTPTAPPSLSPVPGTSPCPRPHADDEYVAAGAKLVPAGSWPEAPKETIILGLKELPEPASEALVPLKHQHIMFAHVYKNHVEPLRKQLENEPRPFPEFVWKRDGAIDDIDSITADDFELQGYSPHAKIEMKMAV